jgi:hypothetical protein
MNLEFLGPADELVGEESEGRSHLSEYFRAQVRRSP